MNATPNPKFRAASNALLETNEISTRLRAILDMMTGNGFLIFEEMEKDLREGLINQAYILAVEVTDKSGIALNGVCGGAA